MVHKELREVQEGWRSYGRLLCFLLNQWRRTERRIGTEMETENLGTIVETEIRRTLVVKERHSITERWSGPRPSLFPSLMLHTIRTVRRKKGVFPWQLISLKTDCLSERGPVPSSVRALVKSLREDSTSWASNSVPEFSLQEFIFISFP